MQNIVSEINALQSTMLILVIILIPQKVGLCDRQRVDYLMRDRTLKYVKNHIFK